MIELQQHHNKRPVFINEQFIASIEEKEAFTLITMVNNKVVRVIESLAEIAIDLQEKELLVEKINKMESVLSDLFMRQQE